MERNVTTLVADMQDEAAMPRKNGELVFEAPWEARAFGLAVALNEKGQYEWDAFRQLLIDEIGQADQERGDKGAAAENPIYYEQWLAALQRLLLQRGLFTEAEMEGRLAHVIAENDHGHSHHGHSHSHPHDH